MIPRHDINDDDVNFFTAMCQEMFANPSKFNHSNELKTLVYFMISSTDIEVLSFVRTFFKRYDTDGFYMLSFHQFRSMMESMARKFTTETMNNYFLMLDKFNYLQNEQKDKVLSQKKNKDDYFGPFVMETIFKIFASDYPVAINSEYEKRTDFWKFLPFLLNMTMLENMREIKIKKDKFYVAISYQTLMGVDSDGTPIKSNKNSIYSIMCNVKGLDDSLAVKVSFDVLDKTLRIYKTLNVNHNH